ncbi:MAG TPA: aldolase/citrate lyase family protein [Bryobacteraceae bacterium]|nr:aldolase/citrate lyase family protein [Bryobacteraceae bacterium]
MSESSWQSPVKRKLREGKTVLAATIMVNSVEVAAHLSTLGFDFLWIEMEHSPITLESLRNMVLATRGLPTLPFARVPVNELWTAKRVLDAGVYGVMFPFTSTPELARQAAEACHYPPLGRRGSGPTLAKFAWPDGARYHDSADENVTVIAIIEEGRAVDKIDEIAATPGLDALFIGTSDLSFSLGLRGNQTDPKLHRAIAKVVDAGKRYGIALGRPAGTPEQVLEYQKEGFQLFQAPGEIALMTAGARKYLGPLVTG